MHLIPLLPALLLLLLLLTLVFVSPGLHNLIDQLWISILQLLLAQCSPP